MRGKNEEFWERVKEWDVIGLVEIWVEKEEWKTWERKEPEEFRWSIQGARKERSRAKEGIWMGIRRELEGGVGGVEKEWLMIKEIKEGGEK